MTIVKLELVPWAPGTNVGAYQRKSELMLDDGPPPMIPLSESKPVAADASVTFSTLPDGEWWAAAPLNGAGDWRYLAFHVETPDLGYIVAGGDLGGAYPDPIVVKASGDFTVGGQLRIPTPGAVAGLILGGDANLYRSAADILKTDDSLAVGPIIGFAAGGGGQNGIYAHPTGLITVVRPSSSPNSSVLRASAVGDTVEKFALNGDGKMWWGSGSLAQDANLYRSAADVLKTDDSFIVQGNLTVNGQISGGGSPVSVLSGIQVRDVGQANQIRAGRQLTAADFTDIGLIQPTGLWNLSDLTNLGSDGRSFTQKVPGDSAPAGGGVAVPFGIGINGLASTAADFLANGSAVISAGKQALYIQSGLSGTYNTQTGSWGAWIRTAKRGGFLMSFLSKMGGAAGNHCYDLYVSGNNAVIGIYLDGTTERTITSTTDVVDDRWHFVVGAFDGTRLSLYIDGALDAWMAPTVAGLIKVGVSPLNVGGRAGDAATAAAQPFYGLIDEAFITQEVLNEDQVRLLYAAKIAHTLGAVPSDARLSVHRKRRGGAYVVGDFSATPLRFYNFSNGDLVGAGSDTAGNRTLINNGGAVSSAGADGAWIEAFYFGGAQSLSGTDAGLPATTATRSYGCWFKTMSVTAGGQVLMGWGGALNSADTRLSTASGLLNSNNGADGLVGPFVADGQWHLAVVVEENAPLDAVKRKLYLDGRLVGGSTVLNSVTLTGANRFRLGAHPDASFPFTGSIDGAFVCGYAMTMAEIASLNARGSKDHGASPKEPGAHVERMDAASLLFIGDTLEPQGAVDLKVAA